MSCHQAHRYQARCHYRFWIGATLLGVAACVSIASPQAFSKSYTASQSALPSAPGSVAIKAQDPAIEPADWNVMSCNSTHPVLCIYTNRGLASHIEQGLAATDRTKAAETAETTETTETAEQSHHFSDTAALKRKIRFLTRLKALLDTVS